MTLQKGVLYELEFASIAHHADDIELRWAVRGHSLALKWFRPSKPPVLKMHKKLQLVLSLSQRSLSKRITTPSTC